MARIERRRLLKGIAAAGLAAPAIARFPLARAQSPVTLSFMTWGAPAEQEAFNALIAKYRTVRPNVTIRVELVPGAAPLYQQVDTRLAGRQAPDLFRIQYQHVGRYARDGGTVDLSQHVDADYGAAFAPIFWQTVNYRGKPFALPHHTDTFALYYNVEYMRRINMEPPTSLEQSWTWEQFMRAARAMKEQNVVRYPFAMGFQNSNAYRWLIYLHQHGGRFFADDLRTPEIASRQGIETIAWTQSWFREQLVPPNTSLKSTEPIQNLFANGTIGMMLNGDWQIPFLQQQMTRHQWGVTYMIRDVAMASDLGGNCLAVSRDSRNRDAAADFLKFLVNEENMRDFIKTAMLLPVRRSLIGERIEYPMRTEAMKVFIEQVATIQESFARAITIPEWSRINQRLADELDLAFTSGQSPEVTARNAEAHARAAFAN